MMPSDQTSLAGVLYPVGPISSPIHSVDNISELDDWSKCAHTWAHVARRPCTVVRTAWSVCRQPKIAQLQLSAVPIAHYVLWLDVTVKHTALVTVLQRVDELAHCVPDEFVVAYEGSALGEELEQVSAYAVVEDEEDVAVFFDNSVQGHDTAMGRDGGVKTNFTLLKIGLTAAGLGLDHALHGVGSRRAEVESAEDDSARAMAEGVDKAKSAIVDDLTNKLVNAGYEVRHVEQ